MKLFRLQVILFFLFSMDAYPQGSIDVLHYKFEIELSDKSDIINGKATIQVKFLQPVSGIVFDLKTQKDGGKGMKVDTVTGPGMRGLTRYDDSLLIALVKPATLNDTATYTVIYSGIPADGLIISRNKYGKRTFFADNWPNRGHNWLPCVDDPADKASVEFIVTAPEHYQVVSNGIQVEETDLPGPDKRTHWKEDVPVATKVMVIGAAEFAVSLSGTVDNCIPVYSWVYPEDRDKGFYDYALANEILPFFIKLIGPYGYKKLANVQSKTTFGGLENANTIFYAENSVTGTRKSETLVAHEIAHQWFGNMATEKSFAHLWLSEGFATYMTIVYMENKYGADTARAMLAEDRQQVASFAKSSDRPVVDSISGYMQLLNANSYQKGGWVLHMLRHELGDPVFYKSIRSYYARYAGKNADTRDLQQVFETVSGKDLSVFFRQWLHTPGIPRLDVQYNWSEKDKKLTVTVNQLQKTAFQFPLELGIQTTDSKMQLQTLKITAATQSFVIPAARKPVQVKLDPAVNLLFDGNLKEIK